MKNIPNACFFVLVLVLGGLAIHSERAKAQTPAVRMPHGHVPHILVVSETKGFEHDSISDAMATIWKMGHDTELWEATLRTDTELITKKDIKDRNVKNLKYFDALVFASTTGELDLTEDQKSDMLSFIKDDGKGFVGIHAAADTNYKWPEYGDMIGGWFDQHPWTTFKRRSSMNSLISRRSATSRTNSSSATRSTRPRAGHATR